MTIEKFIAQDVSRYAMHNGFLSYEFKSTVPPEHAGKINLFITPKGKSLFIRFKSPRRKINTTELSNIDRFNERNCIVYVVDSIEKGFDIINYYKYSDKT
jgi:hypothetical protein